MAKQVRWGVLGTARINEKVVPIINASEQGIVRAIASRDTERAREHADKLRVPEAYGSYDSLLRDASIDAVYVSLPNALHFEWVKNALMAGKHVLCEKPMVLSRAHLEEIAEIAQKKGLALEEGFMYRHHPHAKKVKALVSGGELGEPRILRGSFHFTLQNGSNIRVDANLGGGSIWDVGCYLANFTVYLAESEVESVSAQGVLHNGVDVCCVMNVKFKNGILAVLDCGFMGSRRNVYEILGSKAVMHLQRPFKPTTHELIRITADAQPDRAVEVSGPESAFEPQFENFHNAVLTGSSLEVSLAESARTLQILEVARSKFEMEAQSDLQRVQKNC